LGEKKVVAVFSGKISKKRMILSGAKTPPFLMITKPIHLN